MKKATKVWLIVAAALMVAGVTLCAVCFVGIGFDVWRFETVKYETNEYTVTESFENLIILTETANINLIPSEDGICRVVCFEQKNEKHEVSVQDKNLTITYRDTRKWYEHIGIGFRSSSVTVYLPQEEYNALTVQRSTGNAVIAKEFDFATAKVQGSTGNVSFYASVAGALEIKQSTGDILVEGSRLGSMKLTTTTGNIEVKSVVCASDAELSVSTGDAELIDVQCGALVSKGSTGELEMERVLATGKMSLARSTGNVELHACDASELWIHTDTGNVSGSLLTEKDFHASSDTGRIRVPETRTGGLCTITTDTGNITMTLCES